MDGKCLQRQTHSSAPLRQSFVQHRGKRRAIRVKADSQQSRGFQNPFGKKEGKEEEARKALQGLFKDKKDTLAAFDLDSGYGGGGPRGRDRKATGGGDDGNSERQKLNLGELSLAVRSRLGQSLRALSAVIGFVGIVIAIPLIPQLFGVILAFVKTVLRLDGRARSLPQHLDIDPFALAGTTNLGTHEVSVLRKYGNNGS